MFNMFKFYAIAYINVSGISSIESLIYSGQEEVLLSKLWIKLQRFAQFEQPYAIEGNYYVILEVGSGTRPHPMGWFCISACS